MDAMASVTVGQHPDQQLFLQKLTASERKKFMRKSSMSRRSIMGAESAAPKTGAAVSAPLASLNHSQPPGHCATAPGNGLSVRCGVYSSRPPRSTDLVVDCGTSAEKSCKCGCMQATMTAAKDGSQALKSCKDGENVNTNNGNASREQVCNHVAGGRRTSMKDSKSPTSTASTNGHCNSSRYAGRRLSQGTNFRSLTSDGADCEGLHIDRLTQGRSGVVKIMRSEPPRREAWSIFHQEDPRVKAESGEGHSFSISRQVSQDWCDVCNSEIGAQAQKCKNCSYTCHLECQGLVQLDCNQRDRQAEDRPSPGKPCATPPREKNVTKAEEVEKPKSLSEEEVKTKIEEYNSKVSENVMNLGADGAYTGFIKVHLKVRRPVSVLSTKGKPPGAGAASEGPEKKTSFYLPTDAVKQLHISSATEVSEVIKGLLAKFMVVDDPRKFALYRQTHRDGQDLFQKLPVSEHPLYLRLVTGPDPEHLTFVLKDNQTGEVEWHAFSVPELQNFLAILEKEERERMRQVEQRYVAYRSG